MNLDLPDPSKVLSELRACCEEVRALIGTQYPPALIGYFWNKMFLSLIGKASADEQDESLIAGPEEQVLIFAMEYIHAVIASDGVQVSEFSNVDTEVGDRILEVCDRAMSHCFVYGMVDSKEGEAVDGFESQKLAFEILSNWVMIRGKRYQVLEEDFFAFTLSPHDETLQELYGIDSSEIAFEIQKIADASRTGVQRSAESLSDLMEQSQGAARETGISYGELLGSLAERRPDIAEQAGQAIRDLFFGGTFNISRHSNLPEALLSDLAYQPGEAQGFFDSSDYSGTPFKTLPARIKPLIAIGGEYYCTDPNLVRDSSYRAIQRAIIAHRAAYREEWNAKQKDLTESAFHRVMNAHLRGAQVFYEVYYPLPGKQWAEADCLLLIDDVLISVECKAGVEALNPPAENMTGHLKSVERLLLSAYRQCSRFIEYLHSSKSVPIFRYDTNDGYQEIRQISVSDFRVVLPVGLTLESFTPFSSTIKELAEVVPICGRHNFFALSVDDLMSIRYILSGTGEFLHYLEVRQALAGMKNVMLFDEMDHLGAYVSNNRVDQTVQDMLDAEKADFMTLDGFDVDVIGPFFHDPDFPNAEPRRQAYPTRLLELLQSLERTCAPHWLTGDSFLRNMGSEGREQFQTHFDRTLPILQSRDATFFATGGKVGAVFWLERHDGADREERAVEKAQSLIVALGEQSAMLFRIALSRDGHMAMASAKRVKGPSAVMANYGRILEEANRLRPKVRKL